MIHARPIGILILLFGLALGPVLWTLGRRSGRRGTMALICAALGLIVGAAAFVLAMAPHVEALLSARSLIANLEEGSGTARQLFGLLRSASGPVLVVLCALWAELIALAALRAHEPRRQRIQTGIAFALVPIALSMLVGPARLQRVSTDRALRPFAERVRKSPDDARARLDYASALLEAGRPKQAAAEAQKGRELTGDDDPEGALLEGAAYLSLAQPQRAAEPLALAYRSRGRYLELAGAGAKDVLERAADKTKAESIAKALAGAARDRADYASQVYAMCLMQLGLQDDARAVLEKLVQERPDQAGYRWLLVIFLRATGDDAMAQAQLEDFRREHAGDAQLLQGKLAGLTQAGADELLQRWVHRLEQ
jgi:tetratricopeptide (TPR) repeat protein